MLPLKWSVVDTFIPLDFPWRFELSGTYLSNLLRSQAVQAHYTEEPGRDSCFSLLAWYSFLRAVLCYNGYGTKACMGCKRFFLKARKNQLKNVMFLNKIDLPYCLVVFFVVCSRLRPFWSVFGELPRRYFGVPLLREIQGRTVINFLSVRRSRRIIPLEHYPRPQFLQNFKAEKLQFHVHSLDSQFLNGSLEESSSKCGSRSSKR